MDTKLGRQAPEWYGAQHDQWTLVAKPRYMRFYHSTAQLLPDGSVLATGASPTMEIYKPWYFSGPRPVIAEAPDSVGYGEGFVVQASPGAVGATLLRIGGDTHNLNTDQRFLRLAAEPDPEGTLRVRAPASGAVAPPGYYMLFVFDARGAPSEAAMLRLG
jgi:hypothetical protein